MPHNIYLHSSLVQSRQIDQDQPEKVREANLYFFIESIMALVISFIINLFAVSVFATSFNSVPASKILDNCMELNNLNDLSPNDSSLNTTIEVDITKMVYYYGNVAKYIWAMGILAAGSSSTMTGTYAGHRYKGAATSGSIEWRKLSRTGISD